MHSFPFGVNSLKMVIIKFNAEIKVYVLVMTFSLCSYKKKVLTVVSTCTCSPKNLDIMTFDIKCPGQNNICPVRAGIFLSPSLSKPPH